MKREISNSTLTTYTAYTKDNRYNINVLIFSSKTVYQQNLFDNDNNFGFNGLQFKNFNNFKGNKNL